MRMDLLEGTEVERGLQVWRRRAVPSCFVCMRSLLSAERMNCTVWSVCRVFVT